LRDLIVFVKPARYRVSSRRRELRCAIDCADNEQATVRTLILPRCRSCTCLSSPPPPPSPHSPLALLPLALFGIAARCAQCQRDLVKKNEILGPLSKVPLRRSFVNSARPKFQHTVVWPVEKNRGIKSCLLRDNHLLLSVLFELAGVFRNTRET